MSPQRLQPRTPRRRRLLARVGTGWTAPLLAAALVASAELATRGPVETSPVAKEYALKAAFLYKFTGFIDWPASAFAAPSDPFVIAVVGEDPFGRTLDDALAGQRIGAREVVLLRDPSGSTSPTCHVAFVRIRDEARRRAVLERFAGRPVLLVGEEDGFLEAGGMIRLVLTGDRVRFEVHRGTAERSGLKISSKLLALATRVIRTDPAR